MFTSAAVKEPSTYCAVCSDQYEQILVILVDLQDLNASIYYFLLLQVFREPLQSQIPTITGSMGQKVSWSFWIGTSCEMAAGIGWLR